ncbi:FG-GAP-like repeat-containing protein [Saccharothrix saharensis]|uniref:FG-GAP-like repeat-containing protein n=1 Tax=Saccharothrix saharensis TaxID=571190 RepID=UPI0036738A0C
MFGRRVAAVAVSVVLVVAGVAPGAPAVGAAAPVDQVVFWNGVLLDTFRQAGGAPGPLARGAAMTFRAMRAANVPQTPAGVTVNRGAAMAAAAYHVLIRVFNPTDYRGVTLDFTAKYNEALAHAGSAGNDASTTFGRQTAEAEVNGRSNDGWNDPTAYVPDAAGTPGAWRPSGGDCVEAADAGTPNWGKVRPFVLSSGSQFRPPAPAGATGYGQLLGSTDYNTQVSEVFQLGGKDGPGVVRNQEQTEIAWFWANDLDRTYKPPGQLLEHTRIIAERQGLSQDEKAKLFALVAVALADASIAAWDTKFLTPVDLWRPVHGVNHNYPGANWLPLSADRDGNTLTPCFPAWVSGHATFAGAWAGVMKRYFGTDEVPGGPFAATTEDPHAATEPDGTVKTRTFSSFSAAARENALSRLYLGVHYRFDGDLDGLTLGDKVAGVVVSNAEVPELVIPTGTLGDFDLDGKADVLARNKLGELMLYPGTGAPGFKTPYRVGVGFNIANSMVVADFTLDGRPDLVTRQASTGELRLYPHTGNPTAPLSNNTVVGVGFGSVDTMNAADVTLDGRPDLIARRASSGELRLFAHNGNPGSPFYGTGTGTVIGVGFDSTDAINTVDVTLDGRPDLIARRAGSGELRLFGHTGNPGAPYYGTGTGTVVGFGFGSMNALLVGDFTNDRKADLITRQASTGELRLYPHTGDPGAPLRTNTVIGVGWNGMTDID